MNKSRIAVIGAGAIGGLIAARFSQAGHEVAVVARGEQLRAIQTHGLRLRTAATKSVADGNGKTEGQQVAEGQQEPDLQQEPDERVRLTASDDPAYFGPQDVVYLVTKGHSIAPLLPRLRTMVTPNTVVVPAINGLPWWYFHREGSHFEGRVIHAIDPQATMFSALDCEQIVGCVVYMAAEVPEPGVILHNASKTLIFGEPSHQDSARVQALADDWRNSGMDAKVSAQIRCDIWAKLTGNLSFNTVAALTGCHMQQIFQRPGLMRIVQGMLDESIAVANAYAGDIGVSAPKRIEMARKIGPVRPSTLQDYDARRRPELEGLLSSVIELAHLANIAVPTIEDIHALALAKAQTLGLLD